ncbi:hypothetical protein OIU74_018233 [Salix koriyanagi]|uniref:non-specific serine/threonine protein kinase n=1 Tax=Salix koriyanagi TaxID=2511006 RepID=A0A9Q0WRR2_9ROSI|nr:hypothetical protein OIU74_018233 [Salix koriyanagi]
MNKPSLFLHKSSQTRPPITSTTSIPSSPLIYSASCLLLSFSFSSTKSLSLKMNHSFFFTPFSPIVNLFITTFLLLAKKASCTDPHFLACEPKSCGGQNISFPFHIQNAQEEYCGYPGFAVSCNEKNKTVLSLSDNEYIVQEIDYQNHSLRLSNAVGFGKNTSCSPQIKNISLNVDRFRQSTTRTGVFLFYNCISTLLGNDSKLLKHKFDCFGESANVSTVAMLDDDPLLGSASEKCGAGVVAPVDVYRGENVSIGKMLERGFVLNWVASNCSECDESGGRCGFNITKYQFKCFCPDRPHARSCKSGEYFFSSFRKSKFYRLLEIAG